MLLLFTFLFFRYESVNLCYNKNKKNKNNKNNTMNRVRIDLCKKNPFMEKH